MSAIPNEVYIYADVAKDMIMKNMRNYILRTVFLCIVLAAGSRAFAEWNCFITNFDKSDYGYGMSTWRIVSYGHWTYFANQKGMLQFDGNTWKCFPLNNRGETRGVAIFPEQNRLYVGGENEFGYFQVAPSGTLQYTCLSEQLGSKYSQLGNIFDFYESNDNLYMRGDKYIIIKNGGKYRLVTSENKIFASVMKDGILYVATDYGVNMLAGNKLVPIHGGDVLEGKRINAMVLYSDGIIITTANHGLFFYDGTTVRPYTTGSDALISKAVICCAAVKGDRLALGTIHNGLIVIDLKTGYVEKFDESRGLQNNTVISVAFDGDGNVWAGLDNGIDYIRLESPFSYLYRKPKSYGIGFTAMLHEGKLYLGTDRGLYYTDYPVKFSNGDADIHQTDVPSGLTWFLYNAGGDLLCMHDKGIFKIGGGKAHRITDIIGAWSCQSVTGHPELMYVGTYNGMYLIKKTGDTWATVAKIQGIEEPVRYMKQYGQNVVKVYIPNNDKSVTYTLDKSLTRAVGRNVSHESYITPEISELEKIVVRRNVSDNILQVDDSKKIIPYEQGFLMFNSNKVNTDNHIVYIRSMQLTDNGDSVVYASNFRGIKPEPVIGYSSNSVRFEYNVAQSTMPADVRFRYRLNNGEWSVPTRATAKEFDNLYEGTYTFEVMAIFYDNYTATDKITFRILPPWYRTWIAYAVYCLIFILLSWMVKILIERRVERKNKKALVEKNREIRQMKIEIDHLEKEKMDLDLKHKSQEIANLLINVARKNEILLEIKDDIKNVITSGNGIAEVRRQLIVINGKVDVNIKGDDVIRRFEEEFDLVNNNFTKKLCSMFPDLTNSERMLCAYLKMNLSTKDIAPLLNLSVRGVETMRYRIRKKLQLNREDNLTEFLDKVADE